MKLQWAELKIQVLERRLRLQRIQKYGRRYGRSFFLGRFEGILQTDGYIAYDQVGGPKLVRAACWAHARRKFHEAVKLSPTDQLAIGLVAEIDELFAIDARARAESLEHAARHALRQEQARPLLDGLKPPRSTRWGRRPCRPVRWGGPPSTRWRCGPGSRAFWTIPSWN